MKDDESKWRPHAACLTASYCVDYYVGFDKSSCKDRPGFQLPGVAPPSEAHASCAASGFCVGYYVGSSKEPCRRSAVA